MNSSQSDAVTEVMSLILVFGLMTTSISVVMLWGAPYMDEKKAEARACGVLNQLETITDIIKDDVISQGTVGSSVEVRFTYEYGDVSFSSEGERFVIYYSLDENFDFEVSGFYDGDPLQFTIDIIAGPDPEKIFICHLNKDNQNEELDFGSINPSYNLEDAIEISINNTVETIGKIWLFDTGSISYKIPYSYGTFRVFAENGGVVSGEDDKGYLSNQPTIFDINNNFVMRMIQLKPDDVSSGGSGKVTYKLKAELDNHFIRENMEQIKGNLKMQIFGEQAAVHAWKNYFILKHGFERDIGSTEGTIFLSGNKIFSLTHSICSCDVEVEI